MTQIGVDKFFNRLFLDGERFVLRLANGELRTIASRKGNAGKTIFIVKKREGHYLFLRQTFGVNKMLADWAALKGMQLDFDGFDSDGKHVHFGEPFTDVIKAKTFRFKNYEEQYQLVVPFAKKPPAPQGSLF